MKRLITLCTAMMVLGAGTALCAKVDTEKQVTVDGQTRKYVLYVPDNVQDNAPLVFSLHGAAGHDTDRSPMRTSVADAEGFILVYPQGNDQSFPVFGGYIPGWNSTGEANEDLDFFKAMIEDVASQYSIDLDRVYCCGFSNGGMMTYSNTSAASDIFAAFASISGFQLNEFHLRATGYRPVPMLHIHGKNDDFVKYSCMPVIRDMMVARNGCNPKPIATEIDGQYRRSVYEAGEGGFPYIYYEIYGMGHQDYTDRTPEGSSALTMWQFMSQFRLSDECDPTLKWRLSIDAKGFNPKTHCWTVNAAKTKYEMGIPPQPNNADNNVYPSLQLEAGDYTLTLATEGEAGHSMWVEIKGLEDGGVLISKAAEVGTTATMAISVPQYKEYKLTIVKESSKDKVTEMSIHSCPAPATDANCVDSTLPDPDGIADVSSDSRPMGYVSISGICSATPHTGINLVQKSDGSVSKQLIRE